MTTKRSFVVCSLVVLCLIWPAVVSRAQQREEREPTSVFHSGSLKPLNEVGRVVLEAPNVTTLMAEDASRERGQPLRFAHPIEVNITPENSGTWERLPSDGSWVWRVRINSPGAKSLNFGFTRYEMPPGGQLFIYPIEYALGTDPKAVRLRPFTHDDNEEHGQLWTPPVAGEEAVIEVVLPRRQRRDLKLELTSVGYDYTGFGRKLAGRKDEGDIQPLSGACNIDVACPEGDPYRDQIRAVAVLQRSGSLVCSGTLVNNTANDGKPFFITADHCGVRSTNAATVVTFWNFQNSTCRPPGSSSSGGDGDGELNQFNSGSFFRATSSNSDFTLVELDDPLNPAHNLFLVGWDRRNVTFSDGGVGIHHPGVDEKRISISDFATALDADGTHHEVRWSRGVTEGGSSGSMFMNKQKRFIGQLTGGPSGCSSTDLRDFYGRFSVSWTGGGTSSTRLSNWLDPGNTGAQTIDGRNAPGVGGGTTVFSDTFESDNGWVRNPNANDTATTGLWERGNPQGTSSSSSAMQLENAAGGTNALITGLTAGTSVGSNDVDGGVTTIQSPAILLPSSVSLTLNFSFYFAHLGNSSSADFFRVQIVGSGGSATTVFQELGNTSIDAASWSSRSIDISSFAGQTIRIRIQAADNPGGSLVEAGFDSVTITRQ